MKFEKKVKWGEDDKGSILTVSELNSSIRQILEKKYSLVWVQGEVSNFKAPSSGHFYFYIKDTRSNIRCVMFKSYNKNLRFQLKEGIEVLIRGRVTVYEARGDYQIFCELIQPKGVGDLHLAFEALKEKLNQEGLFDESQKKRLPFLAKQIVVMTSPTGAAFRDILNILRRRFRGVRVTLIPALVQGGEASRSLLEGLQKAKRIKDADVLIVTRGGGSVEDLWCFNDEKFVRELFSFPYPVISAVGHEIDFTLCDFVADVRAPTPSAAAELVIKERAEFVEKLQSRYERMVQALSSEMDFIQQKMEGLQHRLSLVHPRRILEEAMISCDDWMQKLVHSINAFLKEKSWRLNQIKESLGHLSPLEILKRGYVIVKKNEQVVYRGRELKQGDRVQISFVDKEVESKVTSVE